MCGGDNHLAWKRPISSEACRGLCTTRGYLVLHALQDWFFIFSVDLSSWVRVEGRLVRFSERSDMDQRVVTVDQFTAAMASI
ncbi:hypothetical protein CK203_112480 [Vitis vinifera]|uniref:Uncharacterized protein n=1 Tax=Vitis vinifera TaxID=29760 RepID=A0A438EAF5_VITVI|nr:hypothetical protein CK203_112480 [Vitis vinifera]